MACELWILRRPAAEATLSPRPRFRQLEPGEVHVWLIRGSADRRGERARRVILARYVGIDPSRICIAADHRGKPRLTNPVGAGLHFNVSHSADLVAVAVGSDGPIGIDVERRRSRGGIPQLAEAILTLRERAWWLRQGGGAVRHNSFYDLWSAKEACAKLTGQGLSLPFREVAIAAPGAATSSVETAGSAPLRVCRLPLGRNFSGSLAWSPGARGRA